MRIERADQQRVGKMLWAQIRERVYSLGLRTRFIFFPGVTFAVHIQLWIDGVIGAAHEASVFIIALKNRDSEMFTIGSHLGYAGGERPLHDEIHLPRTLKRDRPFGGAIFFSYTRGSE